MEQRPENAFQIEFTSTMTKRETLCALLWLPIHIFGLPAAAGVLLAKGILTAAQANLMIYVVSAIYILAAEFVFLRREFDPFCDRKAYCILQVLSSYLLLMAMNMIVSGLISGIGSLFGSSGVVDNLNNDAVMDMAGQNRNVVSAMAIFLAPITEEVMFRGGIFCSLRKKNRTAAYAVSILLFAVYHVWAFAADDPKYWLYILQYVPAGFLLCRCYERTDSIWCSIFLHMLTNGVALDALSAMEQFS